MADEWYSQKPRTRFSKEHRNKLPSTAKMIDIDQVLWIPYDPYGTPLLLVELKPEGAREDFWIVCQRLAEMAGLPAARVIELKNGLYRVSVATEKTNWIPTAAGDLTISEWYEQIEVPLRKRKGV